MSPTGAAVPYAQWLAESGPVIDGFSDKKFSEVAPILIAHASLMGHNDCCYVYAGVELCPDQLFVNPGQFWDVKLIDLGRWLIDLGNWLGFGSSVYNWQQSNLDAWKVINDRRLECYSWIMTAIWTGAKRVKAFLDGPEQFTPTVHHLRDLPPYFGPSAEYAAFLASCSDIEIRSGVDVIQRELRAIVKIGNLTFPRIRGV